MDKKFMKNCCDGIYNSFDVHFTSACDNRCGHCIDIKYDGTGIKKPDPDAIAKTIIENQKGYDDVLFLGGEPCLYLDELVYCVNKIKDSTPLKVFVTTSVPKICHDEEDLFLNLIEITDGINLSVQHHKEHVADIIRNTESKYDRQSFYRFLPSKEKIRINLNIVKPHLYTRQEITDCLTYYDKMHFNSIKLSEIQHGKEYFVSFEDVFSVDYGSPYYSGCQKYIDTSSIIPGMETPVLLKRSCFLCEETLSASIMDGVKMCYRYFNNPRNMYGVVYEDGKLFNGWR